MQPLEERGALGADKGRVRQGVASERPTLVNVPFDLIVIGGDQLAVGVPDRFRVNDRDIVEVGDIVDLAPDARNLCVTFKQTAGLKPERSSLVRVPLLPSRNRFYYLFTFTHLLQSGWCQGSPVRCDLSPMSGVTGTTAPDRPDCFASFQSTLRVAGRQIHSGRPIRERLQTSVPKPSLLRTPRHRYVGIAGRPDRTARRGWSRYSHFSETHHPSVPAP